MSKVLKIVLLARPHNIAVAVFCVATGFIMAAWPAGLPWVLLSVVGLVTAAGNVINDYYDLDIDRINKPARVLPSGSISRKQAGTVYAVVLVSIAVLFFFLPWGLRVWIIIWVILLHLYSARLKRKYLAGNLLVSLVTGSGFVIGAYVGGNIITGAFPAVCTFLFVLGRELVKDCEDLEGDRKCGARTVPVVSGRKAALIIAAVIFILLAVGFIIPWFMGFYNGVYGLIMFISVLPILLISAIFSLREKHYALVSLLLKLGMFFGIMAFLFG